MNNSKRGDMKAAEVVSSAEEIELVNIEDLRTAFGGEDLTATRETKPVNAPTRMCGGWCSSC